MIGSVPHEVVLASADDLYQLRVYWWSRYLLLKTLQHPEGEVPSLQHMAEVHYAVPGQ